MTSLMLCFALIWVEYLSPFHHYRLRLLIPIAFILTVPWVQVLITSYLFVSDLLYVDVFILKKICNWVETVSDKDNL